MAGPPMSMFSTIDGIVGAGTADLLERIEIDDDEVDRLDAVVVHGVGVLGIVADAEQPAMHRRMQRLDAAVHDLGKAGQLGDVAHRDAGRRRSPWPCRRSRPARRRPAAAPRRTRPGRSCRTPTAARGGRGTRSGAGMFLEATAMAERSFRKDVAAAVRRAARNQAGPALSESRPCLLAAGHAWCGVSCQRTSGSFRGLEGEHDLRGLRGPPSPAKKIEFLDVGSTPDAREDPACRRRSRSAPAGPRSSVEQARCRDGRGSGR